MGSTNTWKRKLVLGWTLFSAIATGWDLSWCFVHRLLQDDSHLGRWRQLWTLYGDADRRFLRSDPFVVVLEIVTGALVPAISLWIAHAIWKREHRRATVALLFLSTAELYGTVLYFGTELANGMADINTASFTDTVLLFFGLNGLWLIFPAWCIYLSVRELLGESGRAPARQRLHGTSSFKVSST
jgi:hypothetical protein